MKINRDDLSLCSYCGAPVQLGEQKARISALQKRLGKMPEHKNFEAAMAYQPGESEQFMEGLRDRSIARWWAAATVASAAWALTLILAHGQIFSLPMILQLVFLLLTIKYGLRAKKTCTEAAAMPLLKRIAIVHERRSETTYKGSTGKTVYFFDIEFADGGRAEFRQPGRGPQFEPLVNGNTGIAYSRGSDLLEFKVLRV